jgi:hypothetical protein
MTDSEDWVLGDIDAPAKPAAPASSRPAARPAARGQPKKRRGNALARITLFALWLFCFVGGVLGALFLAAGIVRDSNYGSGTLPLSLAREQAWRAAAFRAWAPGRYLVYLETDDTVPREGETPFAGTIAVRIANPRGELVLEQRYSRPALDHRLNGGDVWSRLGDFHVVDPSFEPWTVALRVETPDPAFHNASSALHVVRDRHLAGMEGLLNYVLAYPASAALMLSFLAAAALPRQGGTWIPALLSLIALAALGSLYGLI